MSRRTKLLITAFFLAPLLLLGVYVVLSWSPESPLRIRLLTPEELSRGLAPVPRYVTKMPSMKTMIVLVENTCSVPIRLYGISEGDQFSRDDGMGYPAPAPSSKPTRAHITLIGSMPVMTIPPHSSLHFEVLHTASALPYPPEKVGCIYASRTKEAFLSAFDWCTIHFPTSLRFLIPDLRPDWLILPVHPAPRSAAPP